MLQKDRGRLLRLLRLLVCVRLQRHLHRQPPDDLRHHACPLTRHPRVGHLLGRPQARRRRRRRLARVLGRRHRLRPSDACRRSCATRHRRRALSFLDRRRRARRRHRPRRLRARLGRRARRRRRRVCLARRELRRAAARGRRGRRDLRRSLRLLRGCLRRLRRCPGIAHHGGGLGRGGGRLLRSLVRLLDHHCDTLLRWHRRHSSSRNCRRRRRRHPPHIFLHCRRLLRGPLGTCRGLGGRGLLLAPDRGLGHRSVLRLVLVLLSLVLDPILRSAHPSEVHLTATLLHRGRRRRLSVHLRSRHVCWHADAKLHPRADAVRDHDLDQATWRLHPNLLPGNAADWYGDLDVLCWLLRGRDLDMDHLARLDIRRDLDRDLLAGGRLHDDRAVRRELRRDLDLHHLVCTTVEPAVSATNMKSSRDRY